ncbi:MAG TPA: 5-oxoprolinase subunit PxpA [Mycobacteriales bacterium]|nr:5-oxoprolinase subunit PxpA [Mycobacteriales bacterium]
MSRRVDLNADLGEGFGAWRLGDDEALLDVISSANVACGFHAGDPSTLARTVALAARRGVRVGAQVSYPDLVGFGRRRMDVQADDLTADVLYQIGALHAFCKASGTRVSYVKPHGALYNRIVDDDVQARAVVEAIVRWNDDLPLVTLEQSVAAEVAEAAGVRVVSEAFADRAYTSNGRLVDRRDADAVLTDPVEISTRVVRMVRDGVVRAIEGVDVTIHADSICVHGDTRDAVAIARAVRGALESNDVTLQPWQ